MLRIFRLNPKFRLDIEPPNIMYIDIETEGEIATKYIKEKQLEQEFKNRFCSQLSALYRDNYLVLQPRGPHNTPTISDIDIVKSVPEFNLPCTYAVSLRDITSRVGGKGLQITEPLAAEKPSKFVIGIRSVYSTAEKLTVDQNEALTCAVAYYYPTPLPRAMLVDEESSIFPQQWEKQLNSALYNRTVDYKGHEIVPVPVEIENTTLKNDYVPIQSYSRLSDMYFVHYSDADVHCKVVEFRLKYVEMSIDTIPPAIHSKWILNNLLEKLTESVRCNTGELFSVNTAITKLESALAGPYKDAFLPHLDKLKSFK